VKESNDALFHSGSSAEDSRTLPSEPDDAEGSFSKSDTVVSHTDDVSSSSSSFSAASSPSTSDFSSRSPSHGASSDAPISDISATPADFDAAVGHRHERHRHHHHRHSHADPRQLQPHPQRSHHGVGGGGLHSATAATSMRSGNAEGYVGVSETGGATWTGRVQTSEHTRFTQVLAAGGRGTAEAHPLHRKTCRSGSSPASLMLCSTEPPQPRWWRRPGEMLMTSTPTRATDSARGAIPVDSPPSQHPYRYVSPTDVDDAPLSFSPSPVRKPDDESARGTAAPPSTGSAGASGGTSNTTAAAPMPNPHTQRPRSSNSGAAVSPPLTAEATPPTASAPLPPTHPRRSASAQQLTSNSPTVYASGGGSGPIRATPTLFARNSSGCSPPPFFGGDVRPPTPHNNGSANNTPTCKAALRRASSFTAGMLPPVGSWPGDSEGHPYLVSAATLPPSAGTSAVTSSLHAPRVPPPLSEKFHERTSSVASSVHSASSSARPSVPLPPPHVGPASNLMAAVWVDLPTSQPGSRCATPINGNGESQQQQQRRRRTTPRRGSEPPSSATSTLAASVASSSDGNGNLLLSATTAATAALASVRLHYVTVGTQTDNVDYIVVEQPPQQSPLSAPAKPSEQPPHRSEDVHCLSSADSLDGHHTPEKTTCVLEEEEEAEASPQRQPFHAAAAIVLPTTVASVSSTSAEISPRSLRVSTVDAAFDDATMEKNSASRSSAALNTAVCRSSGGARQPTTAADTTEVPVITASPHTHHANVPLPQPPARESCLASPPVSATATAAGEDGVASPAGVTVSPVTPELPTLQETPSFPLQMDQLTVAPLVTTAEERERASAVVQAVPTSTGSPLQCGVHPPPPSPPMPSSVPVEGPHVFLSNPTAMVDASQGVHCLTDHGGEHNDRQLRPTMDPTAAAAGVSTSSPSSLCTVQAEEVRQLRSELARMRTQYAEVLDQLRLMQLSSTRGAAGAAGTSCDAEAVSAVSRSPPSSSSASSSFSTLSTSLKDAAGSAVSSTNAAATLQHVREALERTRHRATT
jgi:hypothetical protein